MNYLISSIQLNGSVNKTLLRNMKLFAKNHDARILLYVMPGKTVHETLIPTILLDDENIELLYLGKEGRKLNNNLKLHDTRILASQINPLTGFQSKLSNKHSYVLPSSKIRFLSIPNTSNHPRFLATTGSLTHGNYKDGSSGASNTAQGRKAALEHEYGFAYVQIKNSRKFDWHPVAAMRNGNFHYLSDYYKNAKVYKEQVECLVFGDIHVGDTCMKALRASMKQIEELKPKRVFLHDVMNGHSINHHEGNDVLSSALQFKHDRKNFEDEAVECLRCLNSLANKFPDVAFYIVESNHDLFIRKYLGNPNFIKDSVNAFFATGIFHKLGEEDGRPILQLTLETAGEVAGNIEFLQGNDEFRVKGWGFGLHGHKGVSGSRGSSKSYSNHNLKLFSAHEHGPKIYANGICVGTMTCLELPYTFGSPGGWMHANGVMYSSGKGSLLVIIH